MKNPKLNMRKLNKCWRKFNKGGTKGVKLEQKLAFVIGLHGMEIPTTRPARIALVVSLIGCGAEREKTKNSKRAPTHKGNSKAFYASWEWKQVRYEAFMLHGRRCMCCGWAPADGGSGHLCVDHIKPRSKFPELELELSNTQVLCNSCNMGKSNVYEDDFRGAEEEEDEEDDPLTAQFRATMQ